METLREGLYKTIHRNKKPLKVIAEEIGMSENYLTRAALPDAEDSDTGTGCRFPLKKLIPLINTTNDYSVLDVIEQSVGRIGVLLPPSGNVSTKDICHLTIKLVKEYGELLCEVESALEDDKIESHEYEKIQREGYHAIQAILSLMEACKG
jgi:hypothetical protein